MEDYHYQELAVRPLYVRYRVICIIDQDRWPVIIAHVTYVTTLRRVR